MRRIDTSSQRSEDSQKSQIPGITVEIGLKKSIDRYLDCLEQASAEPFQGPVNVVVIPALGKLFVRRVVYGPSSLGARFNAQAVVKSSSIASVFSF
ncbi:hypothetical protein CFIO01_06861 [Colletotrichum fioriniae PJ7]|uniref:Uncharacterized protein n=1 Tax=Colletotrichum fioriniae PJ7 TaxID=1445577 RepID=A0A010S738_9PEZI|nr:hypothetical protein CFIO01_06861 [Colletotrichum fioriniae PJ7]